MTPTEFVACWKRHKDALLADYTAGICDTAVAQKLATLNLNDSQVATIREIIDDVLTDAHYAFLLGLDGAANIGGVQQPYRVLDEHGNPIGSPGDLEAEAWDAFHGDDH